MPEMSDIETLSRLQDCDTEHARSKRELDGLEEAKKIVECRARRKELKGKQDQVVELAEAAMSDATRLQDEKTKVSEKIQSLKDRLNSTSDYRVTQSVTRDLSGQEKRLSSIATEQDAILERQVKIDNLSTQVKDMLAKVDRAEEAATAEFKRKGSAIKERMDSLAREREELLAGLPEDLALRYERTRKEKGGIALCHLQNNVCTGCSTEILTGQLAKLKKGPVLSECPHCHRIMIVEDAQGGDL